MFEVTFGEESGDSQQDRLQDTLTTEITQVRSTREAVKVTVEDGGTKYKGQRAHVTANLVHVAALETLLMDKTWIGAWTALSGLWQFASKLKDAWYAQDDLTSKANKTIQGTLDVLLDGTAGMITDEHLVRDGVNMSNAWYVVPVVGTPEEQRTGRLYFDHDPQPAEYDGTAYAVPIRWKPNLSGLYVGRLTSSMEEWVKARSLFPWTSVDTDSYLSGERSSVEALDRAIAGVAGNVPTTGERTAIVAAMLATFDFFPPSLTQARTVRHGAGVAARHVVENFYYHPRIQQAWRARIASSFLDAWKTRTEKDIKEIGASPTKKAKTSKITAASTGRKLDGLQGLLDDWDNLANAYGTYITAFSAALT